MRDYEVVVVLKSDLEDQARAELLERIEGWLKGAQDGEAQLAADHWGKRQLAYPIKKQTEGYYILYNVQLDPGRINEIERNMLYVDDILRHLVVRKGE